jgi:uncharacterized SAM-binding protein YcdF (DUF218 family)
VVVASGGAFVEGDGAESPATADLLVEWGVPREAIVVEGRSGTTRENAVETAKLLAERSLHRVLLVTSAAHMGRALGAFRAVGVEAVPAPADFQVGGGTPTVLEWLPDAGALRRTNEALREWMGRAWYGLRGWTR